MNITRNHIDELNAEIKVSITKEDYSEKVENSLKEYRKKVSVNGFRPGKAPMGLVKKNYGKSATIDEINKLLFKSLQDYITSEKLDILGEPLPSDSQSQIDFDNDEAFEFVFEVGLAPEFNIDLSKNTTVPYYKILVTEQVVEKQIENIKKSFGSQEKADEIGEKSVIRGNFIQTAVTEAPIITSNTAISLEVITDNDTKNALIGKKVDETIQIDVKKAFTNETDLASMLQIVKTDLENLNPEFEFTITEITNFKPAELSQEIYDKAYGEGTVNSEEELKERIVSDYSKVYEKDADYKFLLDAKDILIEQANITLPVQFLKRWMVETNREKNVTMEAVDADWHKMEPELKWQLIQKKIIAANNIEINEADLIEGSKKLIASEFERYGIPINSFPEDRLNLFAAERLNKPEDKRQVHEFVVNEKIQQTLKETLNHNEKEISYDDFGKLFE